MEGIPAQGEIVDELLSYKDAFIIRDSRHGHHGAVWIHVPNSRLLRQEIKKYGAIWQTWLLPDGKEVQSIHSKSHLRPTTWSPKSWGHQSL